MDDKEAITRAARAAADGRLMLFVGTGLSKAIFGNDVPDWRQLLLRVGRQLNLDQFSHLDKCDEKLDYPAIATEMIEEIKKLNLKSTSRRNKADVLFKIEVAKNSNWHPSKRDCDRLRNILKDLNVSMIVTTNYDEILETVLADDCERYDHRNSVFPAKMGKTAVWHIHGSVRNPPDIVISRSDYQEFFRPGNYALVKLSLLLHEYFTLFVGYSLSDPNLLTALDWANNVYKTNRERSGSNREERGNVQGQLVLTYPEADKESELKTETVGTNGQTYSLVTRDAILTMELIAKEVKLIRKNDKLRLRESWSNQLDAWTSQLNSRNRKERVKGIASLAKILKDEKAVPFLKQEVDQLFSDVRKEYTKPTGEFHKNDSDEMGWFRFLSDLVTSWPLDQFPLRSQAWFFDFVENHLAMNEEKRLTEELKTKGALSNRLSENGKARWRWLLKQAEYRNETAIVDWAKTIAPKDTFNDQ